MFKNKIITAAIALVVPLVTFSANAANINANINSSTLIPSSDNNFTGNFTIAHDSASLITIGSLTTNTNNQGIISMDAGAGAFDVINLGTSANKLNSVVFAVGSGQLNVRGNLNTVGDVSSATISTGRLSVLGSASQLISASSVGGSTGLNTLSTSGSGTKTFTTSGEIRALNVNTAANTILNSGTTNTITTLAADADTTMNATISNTVTTLNSTVNANIAMTAGTSNTVTSLTSGANLTMNAGTFNSITTLNANGGSNSIVGDINTITNANINADTTSTARVNTFTTIAIASDKTLTINSNGGALDITNLSGAVDDTSKLVLNSASDVILDISTGGASFGTATNRLNLTTGGAGLKTIADATEIVNLIAGSNIMLTGATNNISSATIADGKTLNINGAAANISGISVAVNNPSTTSSPITVTSGGTLVVTDGSTVNFDVTALTNTDLQYNLIDASTAGGTPLTVNASTLVATDNSVLLNFQLSRIGDVLKYKAVQDTSFVPSSDRQVVDSLLEISSNDPTLIAARSELINISDAATLQRATKDLQKERNGSLANESINATYISRNILNSRMYEVSNSAAGFAANDSANAGVAAGDSTDHESGMWGQVYGGASKYKKSDERYDSSTGGLMFGFDKKGPSILGNEFESLNGIALSYSRTKIDDKDSSGQGTDINSYYLALYNSNFTESGLGLYNNNALHSTYHDYSTKRNIVVGNFATTATADFSGLQLGATTEFGYGFKVAEKLLISPNAGLSYAFLKQDDYQEKGAGGVGLNVDNNNINSLVSTLGVKAASKFSTDNYSFVPQLSTAWLHNLANNGQASTSSFIAGGSSFRSNSADLPDNLVDFGVLLTAFKSKNGGSDISIRYDLTVGSGFTSHTGYLQYRNLF